MMSEIYGHAAKQNIFKILKDKYKLHEDGINIVCDAIKSENDYAKVYKFILGIYEAAYLKCIKEHEEILKKRGIQVNAVNEKPKEFKSIFPQNQG